MPRAHAKHRHSHGRRDAAEAEPEAAPRARPFWSGTLSFGLVSVPVELYPAQRSGGVSLRMLGPEGTPLTRRYVCPADDKVLDNDELVRGYELDNGEHVVVTDEELEKLDPKKTRDIDLRRFVDRSQLDPLYFERAYFLTPGGEASKAYRLLADVMEHKGRAGIATFVLRDKERVLAIFAENGLLRGQTLRFADEVRSAEDLGLPKKKSPAKQTVQKMERALKELTKKSLDPKQLADASRQRLREIAKKKRADGEDVLEAKASEKAQSGDVVDLMAVLKRSLAEAAPEKPAKRGNGTTARSKR